jgi:hypothetical protein
MFTSLLLASALVMGEGFSQSFTCDDPAFSLMRDGSAATLKGSVIAPQKGFSASFKGGEASGTALEAQLVVSQAKKEGSFGRGLPALETLTINESFILPETVSTLHLSVEGLSPKPRLITCQLAARG